MDYMNFRIHNTENVKSFMRPNSGGPLATFCASGMEKSNFNMSQADSIGRKLTMDQPTSHLKLTKTK